MAHSAASLFLAQAAAPAAAAPAGGGTIGLLFPLLIAASFYFLFFAPQMKKQKEQTKMLAALQTGDEIVTTGGIYGVITNVKDDRFSLRIADGTKVDLAKGFVHSVVRKAGAESK